MLVYARGILHCTARMLGHIHFHLAPLLPPLCSRLSLFSLLSPSRSLAHSLTHSLAHAALYSLSRSPLTRWFSVRHSHAPLTNQSAGPIEEKKSCASGQTTRRRRGAKKAGARNARLRHHLSCQILSGDLQPVLSLRGFPLSYPPTQGKYERDEGRHLRQYSHQTISPDPVANCEPAPGEGPDWEGNRLSLSFRRSCSGRTRPELILDRFGECSFRTATARSTCSTRDRRSKCRCPITSGSFDTLAKPPGSPSCRMSFFYSPHLLLPSPPLLAHTSPHDGISKIYSPSLNSVHLCRFAFTPRRAIDGLAPSTPVPLVSGTPSSATLVLAATWLPFPSHLPTLPQASLWVPPRF